MNNVGASLRDRAGGLRLKPIFVVLTVPALIACAACHAETPREAEQHHVERQKRTEAVEFYNCMSLAVGSFNAAPPATIHACEERAKQLADATP